MLNDLTRETGLRSKLVIGSDGLGIEDEGWGLNNIASIVVGLIHP